MPRIYIALEPDEATRALAVEVQAALRGALGVGARLRFSAAPRLHVTLAFLGEVAAGELARVGEVAEATARSHAPFRVDAGGVGAFPAADRARVLWLGFGAASEPLSALVRELAARLGAAGLATPDRAFTGHLTLARCDSPRGIDARAALARCPQQLVGCPVTELVVMESRREAAAAGTRDGALTRARLGA